MKEQVPGSFRDPSGFLFWHDNILYRQVNIVYRDNFNQLMDSGLYDRLVKTGTLISHQDVDPNFSPNPSIAYKIIQPEPVNFISYPYEWCFAQLKDAALLTLAIAKRSLDYEMCLKDASAYNIQFHAGQPVLIDTLSFEKYHEGKPWVAYRQFCQHFLAPLALMVHRDIGLNQLLRTNIDGVPLKLASKLLPLRTHINLGLKTHLHIHSKYQSIHADKAIEGRFSQAKISRSALRGLFDSLISTIERLKIKSTKTEWANYYLETNYSSIAFENKKNHIRNFIAKINPKSVWDLGANTGAFSRISSDQNILTIAYDIDPSTVTENYYLVRKYKETSLLPLIMDLTNPSPALGWHHNERESFLQRGPADLVLALALIHHLAIGNNVPLPAMAAFLSDLCYYLVIEFVPKSDSQVKRLLTTREDVFPDYSKDEFEIAFSKEFQILSSEKVIDSHRTLYFMKNVNR